AYVRRRGARGPVIEAPQSVDNAFWGATARPDRRAGFQALFSGRLEREKGLAVLLAAWRASGLAVAGDAALVLAGDGPWRDRVGAGAGVVLAGRRAPEE